MNNIKNSITFLKLTIVILLFVLIVIVVLLGKTDFNGEDFHQEEYTVSYGDTLWSIGKDCVGESVDVREWIYEVKKINNISSDIHPGQVITVFVNN